MNGIKGAVLIQYSLIIFVQIFQWIIHICTCFFNHRYL